MMTRTPQVAGLFAIVFLAAQVWARYDVLETEKISSEKRRQLGLPLGKKSARSTFPELENSDGRQNQQEPSQTS